MIAPMSIPGATEGFLGTQSALARSLGAEGLAFTYRAHGATQFQADAAADTVDAINRATAATYDVRDTVRALQADVDIAFGAVTRHLGQIHGAITEVADLLRNPQATASAEACREGYRALSGGDVAIARIYFDRAVEHRQNDVLGCFGRALVAGDEGDYETALRMFATSARAGVYGRRPRSSDRNVDGERLAQIAAMAVLLAVRTASESDKDLSADVRELLGRVAEPLSDCPEVQYEVAKFAEDPVPALAEAIYREPAYAIDAIGRFDEVIAARATTTVLAAVEVDGLTRVRGEVTEPAGYRAALATARDSLAALTTELPTAIAAPRERGTPVSVFAEYEQSLDDARTLPDAAAAIHEALDAATAKIGDERKRVHSLKYFDDSPGWATALGGLSFLVPLVVVAVIVAGAMGGGWIGWIVGGVAGLSAAGICMGVAGPVINGISTGHFESDEASLARKLAEHKAAENSSLNNQLAALDAARRQLEHLTATRVRGLANPHRLEPRMPGNIT
jgi:hypothetical protein